MQRKQLSALEQLGFDCHRNMKEGMREFCVSPYAQADILHVPFPFNTRSKGKCTPPWPNFFLYIPDSIYKERIFSLNLPLCSSAPASICQFHSLMLLLLHGSLSFTASSLHPSHVSSVIHPVLRTSTCTGRPNERCGWPPQRGCGTHGVAEQAGSSHWNSVMTEPLNSEAFTLWTKFCNALLERTEIHIYAFVSTEVHTYAPHFSANFQIIINYKHWKWCSKQWKLTMLTTRRSTRF